MTERKDNKRTKQERKSILKRKERRVLLTKKRTTMLLRVNFINILLEPFLYESVLRLFSLVTGWLCNFLAQKYWHKSCSYNVDEINKKLQCQTVIREKLGKALLYKKMLMKLT
jgi:hypothetical protein